MSAALETVRMYRLRTDDQAEVGWKHALQRLDRWCVMIDDESSNIARGSRVPRRLLGGETIGDWDLCHLAEYLDYAEAHYTEQRDVMAVHERIRGAESGAYRVLLEAAEQALADIAEVRQIVGAA